MRKNKLNNKTNQNRGITLIALIVTLIVLIIILNASAKGISLSPILITGFYFILYPIGNDKNDLLYFLVANLSTSIYSSFGGKYSLLFSSNLK